MGLSLINLYNLIYTYREAINEILKDTKRGAIRSEISGAYGWGSAPKINSRLFGNTLIQVIQTNRRKNSGGIIKRSHSNRQYTPTYLSSNKMSGTVKSDIDSKKDHSSSMRQDSKKVSSECNKSLP